MQERQQESVKDAPSAGDRPRARGEDQQCQAHRSFHRAQMNQQQSVRRLLLLRLRALRCDSSVRQLERINDIGFPIFHIPAGYRSKFTAIPDAIPRYAAADRESPDSARRNSRCGTKGGAASEAARHKGGAAGRSLYAGGKWLARG